jgi:hypothetical protein
MRIPVAEPNMKPMPTVVDGMAWGAVAGAAGATALNLLTYADMAVRARPASLAPQRLVEQLASPGTQQLR